MADAPELAEAQQATETAWRKLNEMYHSLPACEHVRQWRENVASAHQAHQRALAARDRALRETQGDAPGAGTYI